MLFQRCTITLKKKRERERSASVRCIADYACVEREEKRRHNETEKKNKKRIYTQRERAHRTLCEASHLFNPTSSNKKPTTRKKKKLNKKMKKECYWQYLNVLFPCSQTHKDTDTDST